MCSQVPHNFGGSIPDRPCQGKGTQDETSWSSSLSFSCVGGTFWQHIDQCNIFQMRFTELQSQMQYLLASVYTLDESFHLNNSEEGQIRSHGQTQGETRHCNMEEQRHGKSMSVTTLRPEWEREERRCSKLRLAEWKGPPNRADLVVARRAVNLSRSPKGSSWGNDYFVGASSASLGLLRMPSTD